MDFDKFFKKAREIKCVYVALNRKAGRKSWGAREYTEGLVGDVGDLMKLVMTWGNLCSGPDDFKEKTKHELADCLWSLIVIADELGINLEKTFFEEMEKLKKKINSEMSWLI